MADRAVDMLTDAILQRDQPRTTDLFFQMVRREGRSLGDALGAVTAAEAPFVQVPSHINVRDGQITLINNDHTILGLRTAASLAPFLPESHRLLPLLQAVWYVPAGLDIWNQLLGKYPGRYATMKGMNVPPPSYGPVVWNRDEPPIVQEGPVEEQLHAHMIATMSGDVRRCYGLFLGLAGDARVRPRLRDHMLFLGLIDLQDTIIGRKARNTGHKALRARAVIDLADVDRLGPRPRRVLHRRAGHGRRPALLLALRRGVRDGGHRVRRRRQAPQAPNQTPLTPGEVEEMVRLLRSADPRHRLEPGHHAPAQRQVADEPRRHDPDRRGRADPPDHRAPPVHRRPARLRLLQRGELLDADERQSLPGARALPDGQLRQRRRPRQQAPHLGARARVRRRRPRGPDARVVAAGAGRGHPGLRRPAHHRRGQRVPGLGRGSHAPTSRPSRSPRASSRTIRTTRRSRTRRSRSTATTRRTCAIGCCWPTVRLLAGWPKMPGERDCYARFVKEWVQN